MIAARLVARTLRGLEEMTAAQVAARELGRVVRTGHREVHLTTADPLDVRDRLRTADDVLVVAAEVDGIGPSRRDLQRIADAVDAADLPRALAIARLARRIESDVGIDVSASVVGSRSGGRHDVEDVVGAVLAGALRTTYHSRRGGRRPPEGTVPWRVTIDGDSAVVAVRLGHRPAHRRPWRCRTVRGSVHPPLAAAMAVLGGPGPGDVVLDPCCGAGTLLLEARLGEPGVGLVGVDVDPAALDAAAANGAPHLRLVRGDAGRLPLGSSSADRVLVNPPWDRKVTTSASLASEPSGVWREARRVLRDGGRLVALLPGDAVGAGALPCFAVRSTTVVRVRGALASIVLADPA